MFVIPVSPSFQMRALRRAAYPRQLAAARVGAATPRVDAVRVPALDVVETAAGYTATLDVPGVAKDRIKVSIEGRRVDVSTAAATQAEATPNENTQPPEASAAPRYARSIVLPAELEAATAQARLDNGVLTLTLPKRGAATLSVQ